MGEINTHVPKQRPRDKFCSQCLDLLDSNMITESYRGSNEVLHFCSEDCSREFHR